MATIEERAKVVFPNSTYSSSKLRRAYAIGATEQKAIDIDKVCDWLRSRNVLTEASIEGFRKVLEE